MMIDHLLGGYFATAGKWGTAAIDWGMAKLRLTQAPPPPEKDLMELPILNRFAGSPYEANAYMERFYAAVKDMEGKLQVFNKQADEMTTKEQKAWWEANGREIMFYERTVNGNGLTGAGQVRKAMKTLSEITGAMKEVHGSRDLDPAVKRERLMILSKQRNVTAEEAFKTLFPEETRRRSY